MGTRAYKAHPTPPNALSYRDAIRFDNRLALPDSIPEDSRVNSDIGHLPAAQQDELEQIQRVLMEEFEQAVGRATTPTRKSGKILKIILFGSYARSDWVDEPDNGYQSDFDLLIVVNHDDLTDIAHYWYVAEDRILRDLEIKRPVNIIVHSLDEVNRALKRGEYFWVDIARDGILLYELPCHPLVTAMPLTSADALEMAKGYQAEWLPSINRAISTASEQLAKGSNNLGWRKDAAFSLHQATERAYICYLLVWTLYFPRSHNIKFLRSLAEDKEPRLIEAWQRATRIDRRRFELLKRAYVEARYSASYSIEVEDLEAIAASVRQLRDIVDTLCRERLEALRTDAD